MDYFHFVCFLTVTCLSPILPDGSIYQIVTGDCKNGICSLNTFASMTCKPEFFLVGYGVIHCAGYGEWKPSIPTCEGKENIAYMILCHHLNVFAPKIFLSLKRKLTKKKNGDDLLKRT